MNEEVVGKITHEVGWLITREVKRSRVGDRESIHCQPICRTCQSDLRVQKPDELVCDDPTCIKRDKPVKLTKSWNELSSNVATAWGGRERRKDQQKWLNFDQELHPIAEDQAEDSSKKYWARAQFFDTSKGKLLMIMLGEKGKQSKVHLFMKDELDQVTFDAGDIDPKEILMGFSATFNDGVKSETKFVSK